MSVRSDLPVMSPELTEYHNADFEHDHDYPPERWTVDGIAETLAETSASVSIPTYDDEETWESIGSDPLTKPVLSAIRARAATLHEREYSHPRATEYLAKYREDDDVSYELRELLRDAGTLAMAECVERDGRYLDDILDRAWGVCEGATWLGPYHLNHPRNEEQGVEGLPRPLDAEEEQIDLHAAMIVQNLAEIDYLLGDRLHPALRERIRAEAERRVFTAYEERDDLWWRTLPTNNWNAVCNNGVVTAAIHLLDDPERIASIVGEGVASVRHFLDSFGPDGGTGEGVGYWGFGVRNYVELAATLESRTDGEYSLFSPPVVREIAQIPERTELSPDRYPAFSDNSERVRFAPYSCCRLAEQYDLNGLGARGRRTLRENENPLAYTRPLSDAIRNLTWCRHVDDGPDWTPRAERSFFEGVEWWFARDDPSDPEALAVAAKGGHNAESHNHNDCGSFVVHYRGESLLTDPGGPNYFQGYFDDERYEHIAARSLGHSVPYVNGTEQASSIYPSQDGEFSARVTDVRSEGDSELFELDLAGCYPESAGLDSLDRRFALERGDPGRVRLEDRATFADDAPGAEFESVFVSYFPMEATGDGFRVEGDRSTATVTCAEEGTDIDVERIPDAVEGSTLWRVRATAPPVDGPAAEASAAFTITLADE